MIRLAIGAGLIALGALLAVHARSTIAGLETDLLMAFDRLPDGVERLSLALAQLATTLIPGW